MFNARSGLRLPLDGANARWGVSSEQFMILRIIANIATEVEAEFLQWLINHGYLTMVSLPWLLTMVN